MIQTVLIDHRRLPRVCTVNQPSTTHVSPCTDSARLTTSPVFGNLSERRYQVFGIVQRVADGSEEPRLPTIARAVMRVLRVARTIADLEGVDTIADAHVAEALQDHLPTGGGVDG